MNRYTLQADNMEYVLYEQVRTVSELPHRHASMSNEIMSKENLTKETLLRGMTITSGCVVLKKDKHNLVGISIGGGAPYCPCLYIVQIFDGTPAALDKQLQAGDEVIGINGVQVKGRNKVEVARLIQSHPTKVVITFNKLHAEQKQGKSLDIILKKVKHRIVEAMDTSTADTLGLSRAILVNDGLVKKLDEMDKTSTMFNGLVNHARYLLRAIYDLSQVYRSLANAFSTIGVMEPQQRASEAFTIFGTAHRRMEQYSLDMLKQIKPMLTDLRTFLIKAVPDTRLTVKKYLDAKFEYLSYCLKVKEMDDEEYSFASLQEPLYRVETGNYEYRLVLRCRQQARVRFANLRNDVLVKIELLDNKHVQDTVFQLQRFVTAMADYHECCYQIMKAADIFPIEMDLNKDTFAYKSDQINTGLYSSGSESTSPLNSGSNSDSDERSHHHRASKKGAKVRPPKEKNSTRNESENLLDIESLSEEQHEKNLISLDNFDLQSGSNVQIPTNMLMRDNVNEGKGGFEQQMASNILSNMNTGMGEGGFQQQMSLLMNNDNQMHAQNMQQMQLKRGVTYDPQNVDAFGNSINKANGLAMQGL